MFQRIQTIYLMISAACLLLMYFLPFGSVNAFVLRTYGVKENNAYIDEVSSYWFYVPLFILALLILFVLLSYKNRIRQIMILRSSFILFSISYALLAFYIYDAIKVLGGSFGIGIAAFLPFAAMILNWLALRAIRKDEELVKSVDRIR